MPRILAAALMVVFCLLMPRADARDWEDSTGKYQVSAELIARDETMVVLEKANKDLIAVPIDKLSKRDREFLEAKDREANGQDDSGMQDWTMQNGLKVRAAVVDYARRAVVVQRRRGKIYVNDQHFDNLPGVYKKMIPQIVAHFEQIDFEKEQDFVKWVRNQRGVAKTFTCDGVLLELENGDLYGVPFFFFSDKDLKVLQPGWDDWLKASEDDALREQQSLSLRAQAIANRQEEDVRRKVAVLQLQLQGYTAGLFDLWEVALMPPPNVLAMPLSVVVPARSSQEASAAALTNYPNYRVGAVAKVRRRN